MSDHSNDSIQKLRETYVAPAVFQLTHITVKEARGAKMWDVDGKEYIDMVGGIGCVNAGHNPPSVVKAIQKQAESFLHPGFHIVNHEPYVTLAQKLCDITPGSFEKRAAFFNSGAEAVENAIKVAREVTKRPAIISFDGGFHGRTLLAMSLTSKIKPYKYGYGPYAPEVYHLPHPALKNITDFDSYWRDVFTQTVAEENIAAIIFEPELGEGGFIPMPKAFVQHLRALCDDKGIVMIADEVQTGFCRTGKMFAMEHFDVSADIMTFGKSVASGLPLSGIVGKSELMSIPHVGGIGGTFGGNPLCCAAALETITIYEDNNLAKRAVEIGEKVRTFFGEIKVRYGCIGDINGLGAMIGVSFTDKEGNADAVLLKRVIAKALELGVILMPSGMQGNILRTLSPLVISDEELASAFEKIEEALKSLLV